jgi:hypothetical protein
VGSELVPRSRRERAFLTAEVLGVRRDELSYLPLHLLFEVRAIAEEEVGLERGVVADVLAPRRAEPSLQRLPRGADDALLEHGEVPLLGLVEGLVALAAEGPVRERRAVLVLEEAVELAAERVEAVELLAEVVVGRDVDAGRRL